MNINKRKNGDITILDLEGKLLVGEDTEFFSKTLDSLLKEGVTDIIINFEGIKALDSTGLGRLIKYYSTAKKNGGTIKFINISEKLQEILLITGLLDVFEIFGDEEKALKSF